MTVLAHNCRRTTCSSHAVLHHNSGRPALKRRHYVAYLFQANFELHPYDVEK
jgi:hypothetical protein